MNIKNIVKFLGIGCLVLLVLYLFVSHVVFRNKEEACSQFRGEWHEDRCTKIGLACYLIGGKLVSVSTGCAGEGSGQICTQGFYQVCSF